jgi:hypothetical protein
MVKICINCNAENLEEALFCKKCGTKLPTLQEIENARREEQEEADRKWKEEVAKTRQQNEVLNESRRNEGSVSVYDSSSNTKPNSNLPQTRDTEISQSSQSSYTPPTRRHRHHKDTDKPNKSSLNSTSLIIINLSVILILALGVFGYFYMSKEGISIHNITNSLEKLSKTEKIINDTQILQDIFIDEDKKLMWEDDIDSKKIILTWKEAKEHCDNLFLGESADWRLPIKSELNGLVDGNNYPAIKDGFNNVSPTFYWANSIKSGSSFAWHIFFGKGGGVDYEDMQNLNSVRCVRNY